MKKLLTVMTIAALVGSMGIFNVSISEAKELKTSGFLEDYSGFEESEEVKGLHVRKNSNRTIGDYNKFLLDPITVYFAPRKGLSKINPKRITNKTTPAIIVPSAEANTYLKNFIFSNLGAKIMLIQF